MKSQRSSYCNKKRDTKRKKRKGKIAFVCVWIAKKVR
jgi:hypothetical protein